MSLDASRWAWAQTGLTASQKLILLSMADRSGSDSFTCYPSVTLLSNDTCLNMKTVQKNIKKLESLGLIDINRRPNKSSIYSLNGVDSRDIENRNHYVYKLINRNTSEFYYGVRTTAKPPEKDKYYGSGRWCVYQNKSDLDKIIIAIFNNRDDAEDQEIMLIKEHINNKLCGNVKTIKTPNNVNNFGTPKNGTPKNGSAETPKPAPLAPPILVDEPIINLSIEPINKHKEIFTPPNWLNINAWDEFEQHRKNLKKPLKDLSRKKALKAIQNCSFDEQQNIIDKTIQNDWTGLFPPEQNTHEKNKQRHSHQSNHARVAAKLQEQIRATS